MLLARQCLYFGLFLNIPIVASQKTVRGHVKEQVFIPCGVEGSYILPHWVKDGTPLTTQDVTRVNNKYPRISYATDNKTLVVRSAELEDSGTYECTHTAGSNSPQNTIVNITEKPEDNACSNHCSIEKAVIAFFVLAIVVITAVIIYCCYILIRAYMEYKKMKVTQEDNNATAELVIPIIAAVLLIVVCIWFIVMQVTVEDCEEMTKKECNINIGLLVVEIFVFVLGVIAFRRAYIWQSQLMNGNCREKIFQILTDAYPDILTVEYLRTKMGVEADIIEQELEKLKKEDLIISRHCGFVVKDRISKTELVRERILQFLGNAFPEALTTDDLQKILPGVEDIEQHLTELEEDHLIRSTQYGFVINTTQKKATSVEK